MKKFKKLLALALTFMLTMSSMSVISFADAKDADLSSFLSEYYSVMYQGYLSMEYTDIEKFYDTSIPGNQGDINQHKNLLLRRRLIDENNYCYVEKLPLPYSVDILSTNQRNDELLVKYVVIGTPDKAYPPFITPNSPYTMKLQVEDGRYKILDLTLDEIAFLPKFASDLISEAEMRTSLRNEFTGFDNPNPISMDSITPFAMPTYMISYNRKAAVQYANSYCVNNNTNFYKIDDSMGDCTNFVSQCVRAGFGGSISSTDISKKQRMTLDWFGGSGGGSSAWENVTSFWNYMKKAKDTSTLGPRATEYTNVNNLSNGDIIQFKWKTNTGSNFNHSVIIVDKSSMEVAQHTPNAKAKYSDLLGNASAPRFLHLLDYREAD